MVGGGESSRRNRLGLRRADRARSASLLGLVIVLASTCSAVPSPNGSAANLNADVNTNAASTEHRSDQTAPHSSDVADFGSDDSVSRGAAVQVAPARAPHEAWSDPIRDTGNVDSSATSVAIPGRYAEHRLQIELVISSEATGISTSDFVSSVLGILNDDRGWPAAGFTFVYNPESDFRLVLAEGDRVDEICWPLRTLGWLSCRNGSTIALNANRWREATSDWDAALTDYRSYLLNHEVGHLLGFGHPARPCADQTGSTGPVGPAADSAIADATASVMAQQTKGLAGCTGNGWPLATEIDRALTRPIVIGG